MAQPAPNEGKFTPPWIDPKESLYYKEMYRDLSHQVNGIATSLTALKFDITAIALGLTLVKADFTLLKVDEKGVTLRGKQLATFKWADEKKHLENRIERMEKKESKLQKKLEDDIKKLKETRDTIKEKADAAQGSGDKAFVYRTRMEIGQLMAEVQRAEKDIERRVAKISRSGDLQEKLDGIKAKEKEAEESRKNVAVEARKTKTDMAALTRELEATQRSLRALSNRL